MTYYIGFHGESSNEATGTVRKLHGFQIYFPEAIKHEKHEERMRKNRQRSNNNIKTQLRVFPSAERLIVCDRVLLRSSC
jgi:hypothetical protein